MRAPLPPADVGAIAAQLEAAPGTARLRDLSENFAAATPDTIAAILDEAAVFADAHLFALNEIGDAVGCTLNAGRVRTVPPHKPAWDAFVAGGWPTLDQPEAYGGQGLPLAVACAVQELFDRACPAFGMLPVPQRSAARLIAAHGDEAMRAEWLPRLVSGEWGATICISEADAGSDAGRMRSLAVPEGDAWSITGEKIWISFGDHDLTPRIGHCLLARTPGVPSGGAGLSLFLVPDVLDPTHPDARNGVTVRRIEDKMGLHASPTCALGFENARGRMIGLEGRGLAQMFVMITNMRLSVGTQGLGVAACAADTAFSYAAERLQGGPPGAPPVPIARHADVQRMLLGLTARVEVLRGLILAVANLADLSAHETDAEARADAAALAQFLLPIVKTIGGQIGQEAASEAVQVLGGAGYTRDWPVEQAMRDARVLTIFEGTTGIQGLDLLHRRLWRGDRRGLLAFTAAAHAVPCVGLSGEQYTRCLDLLDAASSALFGMQGRPRAAEAGATAYLQLAGLAATGWIAARLAALDPATPTARRLIAAGRFWLSDIGTRAAPMHDEAIAGDDRLDLFAAVSRG